MIVSLWKGRQNKNSGVAYSESVPSYLKKVRFTCFRIPKPCLAIYRISLGIRRSFFLRKQPQKSRSVFLDGSRSLGLFRKGAAGVTAKFHRTDFVICSHSRERKPLSYSRIIKIDVTVSE